MNVRSIGLIVLLALSLLLRPVRLKRQKCDQVLMRNFKLTGMRYPVTDEPLHICKNVTANCCTIFDELTIVKLWKDYSFPRIKHFASTLLILYANIFEFQTYISEMNYKSVSGKLVMREWIPYKQKYCSLLEGIETVEKYDPNKIAEQHFPSHQDSHVEKNSRKLKGRKLIFGALSGATKMFKGVPGAKEAEGVFNTGKGLIEGLLNPKEAEFKRVKKKIEDHKKKLLDDQKAAFEEQQKDAYAQMATIMGKEKIEGFGAAESSYTDELKNFLEQSRENLPAIESDNIAHTRDFLYQGKIMLEDLPTKLIYQLEKHKDFLEKLRTIMLKGIQLNSQAIRAVKIPDILEDIVEKYKEYFSESAHTPGEARAYMPGKYEMERVLPEFPEIYRSKEVCITKNQKLYKYFMLYNSIKLRFCEKAKANIDKIRNMNLNYYLQSLKREAESIFELKRGIYCSLCDAEQHKFFDKDKEIVYYSEEFCHDMIHAYLDYIKFNNIIFVEYADELLQYMNCVLSEPSFMEFPTITVFRKIKIRTVFFKRCFENLHKHDFMKYCYFLCKEFNINGLHAYIEGDVHNIFILYIRLIDMLRKNNIPFKMRSHVDIETIKNMDHFLYTGKISEREEDEFFDGKPKNQVRLLEETDKKHQPKKPNLLLGVKDKSPPNFNIPIFSRVEKTMDINNFSSVFLI